MQIEHTVMLDRPVTPAAVTPQRRHDVDWLRILAIGLLVIFHIGLSFQPWAASTGFPENEQLLEELGIFMSLISVWRIPILFLISGMGVRFAMERRDWKQLLKDRTIRILVPYIFGIAILGPVFVVILPYLGWEAEYTLQFGHLWFLLNIFLYVVWLLSLMVYLKDHPDNALFLFLSKLFRLRLGLFLLALPLVLEAWLVNPEYFAVYVDTVHGWLIGLICFFIGFVIICIQNVFWPAVARVRWIALVTASSIFLVRLFVFQLVNEPNPLMAFESMSWMLAILGFGSLYLNRSSRSLGYFSKAVYPVYIVHMPVQFTIAYFLLPMALPAYSKLLLLIIGTFGVSLLLYEVVLRRLKWIRPLFGIKLNHS